MSLRPTRLELEGFGSFRAKTELDFGDADLFVLSGPTGSGKSTVIDAITFALFGVVVRYDDRRLVEPIITKGAAEARVRLDFRVGTTMYSAVRVVRRLGEGRATTREARLERWLDATGSQTETLADGVGDLDDQVERLLGLNLDHFTTCVVLPQGAFQEFLHAKPKARRDLLVDLLDLGVYGKVGQAARTAFKAAETELQVLQTQLDGELADATDQSVDAARARLEQLEHLAVEVAARQPELDDLLLHGRNAAADEQGLRRQQELVASVAVPADLAGLAAARVGAKEQLDLADQHVEDAAATLEKTLAERQALGDAAPLREILDLLPRQVRAAVDLAARKTALEAAQSAAEAADATHARTETVQTNAQTHLAHAQRQNLVAAIASGVQVGDDCPVCASTITALPDIEDDIVATAERGVAIARATLKEAQQAAQLAHRQLTKAEGAMTALQEQVAMLQSRHDELSAAGVPTDPDVAQRRLHDLDRLDQEVSSCRAAESAARAARTAAEQHRSAADDAERSSWQRFDNVRDGLAGLSPPGRVDADLAASWTALADWAATRAPELLVEAMGAATRVTELRDAYRQANAALHAACSAADVKVSSDAALRDAVVRAVEGTRIRAESLAAAKQRAGAVRDRIATARTRAHVATSLGQHLKSDRFQEWLIRRALAHLVHSATADLQAMTDGAYSLALGDNGDFAVVDHRNGDEVRPARTLSGGETFLASLALALALSQRVAELAAHGAARLEALFLDEGFGTLDADTLSTVADALEELGSRGRMVGVITHVPELAARLPVRFDVRKVAGTSTIVRRDAADMASP